MAAKIYRKTALVIAEHFLPAIGQIPKGVYSDGHGDPRTRQDCSWVLDTKEGRHTLRGGDYICTGPAGEQWNVAQEIFEATYEEASALATDLREENERLEAERAEQWRLRREMEASRDMERALAATLSAENERLREALTEIASSWAAHGYSDAMDAVQAMKEAATEALNAER